MLTIHGGRTRRLWRVLTERARASLAGGRRCLVLVPEQYTLQAERSLIADLNASGFFDIAVLSLSRFTQRLLQLRDAQGSIRVDDVGKGVAVARALAASAKDLRMYGRAVGRQGFIAQAGAWIADMKRGDISPQRLAEYAQSLPEGGERDKLSDLAVIYQAYEELLAGSLADEEDVLRRAMDNVRGAAMLQNADVFVYGFDVITDDFSRLLCAVARECGDMRVFLVMDREDAPDGDCFQPVRESAERLRMRFREANLPRDWRWEPPSPLNAPPGIAFLEERLLCGASRTYPAPPESIELFAAPTPYAEAQWIAQRITLLMEQGVQPGDICVLCGDMARYAPILEATFRAWRIPAYIACKRSPLEHGLPRLLLAALRCVTGGYRPEDVVTLIKSGFTPLSEEQGWALENYAIKFGIRGAKWRQPLTRGTPEEIQACEPARTRLIPPLESLQAALRDAADGAQSLRALMAYLEDCQAYETLLAQEEALLKAGLYEQAARARQVWAHILKLFEQMHQVAGGARIASRVMAGWIEAGLTADAISALPPTSGCVTAGAIGHVICFEPEVVFACGLHSGMNEKGGGELLSAQEKEDAAKGLGAYLGMNENERDLLGEIDVWKAFSAPKNRLLLSHAQAAQDGAALRPASAVSAVRRLFPLLAEVGGVSEDAGAPIPLSPLPVIGAIGRRLRAGTLRGQWLEAWQWLAQSKEYGPAALSLLSGAQENAPAEALDGAIARSLFTDRVMSVSRLESYAACPYQHFVTYGLRPQERRRWEISSSDTGVFYHAAMEGFTRALSACPNWPHITRKECDGLMEDVMRPLTAQWQDMAMGDSARAQAEGRRYMRVCRRVAWAFTSGAKQSDFRVDRVEVAFGYPGGPPPLALTMEGGETVYVRGRIDRVDRLDTGEAVYLRVVDYKSGSQELEPARIWMGTQLQLLLYLEAALLGEKAALPAGAFYQWMGEPLIDDEKRGDIEREIAKRLCLKGVALSDVAILKSMDRGDPPVGVEDLLKKDGTPKQGKLACTMEELQSLIRLAHGIAANLTRELRSGHIQAAPVLGTGRSDACLYCDYAGVCRRDAAPRPLGRPLPKVSAEQLLQRAKEMDGKEGNPA